MATGVGVGLGAGERDDGVAAAAWGPPHATSKSTATIARAGHDQVPLFDINRPDRRRTKGVREIETVYETEKD